MTNKILSFEIDDNALSTFISEVFTLKYGVQMTTANWLQWYAQDAVTYYGLITDEDLQIHSMGDFYTKTFVTREPELNELTVNFGTIGSDSAASSYKCFGIGVESSTYFYFIGVEFSHNQNAGNTYVINKVGLFKQKKNDNNQKTPEDVGQFHAHPAADYFSSKSLKIQLIRSKTGPYKSMKFRIYRDNDLVYEATLGWDPAYIDDAWYSTPFVYMSGYGYNWLGSSGDLIICIKGVRYR